MINFEDFKNKLLDIHKNFEKYETVSNSLADESEEYRTFYESMKINFSDAKNILRKSEQSLLIDCYTYAEQLLKNTIYECLGYSSHENDHLNLFLDKKIHPESFSPNPKFESFEKELSSLCRDKTYSFLLKSGNSNIKIYDEMIKSRHRYAHANQYTEYKQYKDSIKVLEYLTWECNLYIHNRLEQINLVKEFNEIIEHVNKIKKIKTNKLLKESTSKGKGKTPLLDFIKKVETYYSKYSSYFNDVELLKQINVHLKNIVNLKFDVNHEQDLVLHCRLFSEEYSPG